jgi:hypothetical protein
VIAIAKQFNQRPSQVVGLNNDYEAFCFDEACLVILEELNKKDSKEPKFNIDNKDSSHYNRSNDDLISFFTENDSKRLNS